MLKCLNLKSHSLTVLVKNNQLKMPRTLSKRLLILWKNSMTSKNNNSKNRNVEKRFIVRDEENLPNLQR